MMDAGTSEKTQPILSVDDLKKLEKSLRLKNTAWLKGRLFQVSTSMDDYAVHVEIILLNAQKSFFYPICGRMAHKDQNISEHEAAHFLLDYIDAYFEDFFQEDENLFLPIDWSSREHEGVDFQVKGQVLNLQLDNLADKLLAGQDLTVSDVLTPPTV